MKEIHLIAFQNGLQSVLQDFNEIDRYLIPPNQIFEYLSAIQELNHWSLDPNSNATHQRLFVVLEKSL